MVRKKIIHKKYWEEIIINTYLSIPMIIIILRTQTELINYLLQNNLTTGIILFTTSTIIITTAYLTTLSFFKIQEKAMQKQQLTHHQNT